MKKLFISISISISISIAIALFSGFSADAKNLVNQDDGAEIVLTGTDDPSETGPRRGQEYIPLRAFLLSPSSCLEIYFLDEIGEVTITLTNLSTGEYCSTIVDSQYEREMIPLSGGAGYYLIRIETSGGLAYYGYFSIYL